MKNLILVCLLILGLTNNVFARIVSVVGRSPVVNDSYSSSWDGNTTYAPSMNAVYDALQGFSAGIDLDGITSTALLWNNAGTLAGFGSYDSGTLTTTFPGPVNTAAAVHPAWYFRDTSAPGADKEIGKIESEYIDGADGEENGYIALKSMVAGTQVEGARVTGGHLSVANNTNIPGAKKHFRFNMPDPDALYAIDHEICIVPVTDAALTVTKITVTCNANPATEFTGDLCYADSFIGQANEVVINDFDTADGVRVDTSITSGAVAAGKCIYLKLDDPDDALTQVSIDVEYDYD